MLRYVLVPEARKDLTEILEYIASDSIDAALRVDDRFTEIFEPWRTIRMPGTYATT